MNHAIRQKCEKAVRQITRQKNSKKIGKSGDRDGEISMF